MVPRHGCLEGLVEQEVPRGEEGGKREEWLVSGGRLRWCR